jgi:hypothetical protein
MGRAEITCYCPLSITRPDKIDTIVATLGESVDAAIASTH